MQHPEGAPLQLALDVVLDVSENGRRVRYRTNTMPGSSGAPCYNLDWEITALHQGSSPSSSPDGAAIYNQGVLIHAIATRLAEEGLLDDPTPA